MVKLTIIAFLVALPIIGLAQNKCDSCMAGAMTEEPIHASENEQGTTFTGAYDLNQGKTDGKVREIPPSKHNEVYADYFEEPTFPGDVVKWLKEHVQWPEGFEGEGKVIVRFNIHRDGSISDAIVIRGLAPAADKEAIRVVNSMPKWNWPESVKDKKVIRYTLPVLFQKRD